MEKISVKSEEMTSEIVNSMSNMEFTCFCNLLKRKGVKLKKKTYLHRRNSYDKLSVCLRMQKGFVAGEKGFLYHEII